MYKMLHKKLYSYIIIQSCLAFFILYLIIQYLFLILICLYLLIDYLEATILYGNQSDNRDKLTSQ